jgi:hypothetical protein
MSNEEDQIKQLDRFVKNGFLKEEEAKIIKDMQRMYDISLEEVNRSDDKPKAVKALAQLIKDFEDLESLGGPYSYLYGNYAQTCRYNLTDIIIKLF